MHIATAIDYACYMRTLSPQYIDTISKQETDRRDAVPPTTRLAQRRYHRLSRLLRCRSEREEFILPIMLAGIVPRSRAAAIISAGRSICTPSEYANASRGEYAGGGRSGIGEFREAAVDEAEEAKACK